MAANDKRVDMDQPAAAKTPCNVSHHWAKTARRHAITLKCLRKHGHPGTHFDPYQDAWFGPAGSRGWVWFRRQSTFPLDNQRGVRYGPEPEIRPKRKAVARG